MTTLARQLLNNLMGTPEPGVAWGLNFLVPASGLTAAYDGGYVRVLALDNVQPAITTEYVIQPGTKLFTASKDTYAYIHPTTGVLTYVEVANGAAKPVSSVPEGAQWLAKIVTDGSNITSVLDLRENKGSIGFIDYLGAFEMSMVTAEQGATVNIPLGYNGRILAILGTVSAAFGATDTGTVTVALGRNGVFTNVTGGVITGAISAAVGTNYQAVPTALNTFNRGDRLRLTSLKTTTGGRIQIIVVTERYS